MINQMGRCAAVAGFRRRHGRRGHGAFTLIEVLVASTIVGTCIAAMVSMWSFAFGLTAKADRESVGYSIGRRALEEVKQTGFQDTAEGTTTVYYDSTGGSRATTATASHTFAVTTVVSSDVITSGVVQSTALRTVTITVISRSTNTTAYTCTTYLARAGI